MEALAKIGIDLWGMLLYLVNYGLLLAVLAYFFYPKVIKTMDERRKIIKKNIEDTEHLQKVLKMQIETHKKEKEEMRAELEKERAENKSEFQKEKVELIQNMEEAKNKLLADARNQINKEKAEILQSAQQETISLMKKIILEVASHKIPEKVVTESVSDSWNKYKNY